jgi:hypothetical protein
MSAARAAELVLLKKQRDGSYLAHTVAEPGTFVAVPEDETAWKPWPKAEPKEK